MRLNRLDLNLLLCLDALLSEKNVSIAAARVFLSQPAMSAALKRLRDHFSDELLTRKGAAYQLTPFARTLQKPTRDAILELRAIADLRPTFDPKNSSRRIAIEASDYAATVFLSLVLQRAGVLAPNMSFDIRLLSDQYAENLDRGAVDILIIPAAMAVSGHPKEPLFTDRFCCVTWAKNQQVNSKISRAKFKAIDHVVPAWGDGAVAMLPSKRATEIAASACVTVPSYSLALQLVIGTQRVATVPARLARKLSKQLPLRVFPCPETLPDFVEAVQWGRRRSGDAAILWFLDLLRAVAREVSAG